MRAALSVMLTVYNNAAAPAEKLPLVILPGDSTIRELRKAADAEARRWR